MAMRIITTKLDRYHTQATLTAYLRDTTPDIVTTTRPAIIICPGGGYAFVSPREAEPIALQLSAQDNQAFVLDYSTTDRSADRYPTQLLELAEAVKTVRANAADWGVDPDRIIVAGFSAGGHLAANLATQWDRLLALKYGYDPATIRPNGLFLAYPVITNGEYGHQDSFKNLLGDQYGDPALMQETSLELQVTPSVPKTFIWHTDADTLVPLENTLLFALALRKAHVPVELHAFAEGGHGLSLATEQTLSPARTELQSAVAVWPQLLEHWLKQEF